MESKTKHRILGIFVLAGLIVIFLPFLETSKELSKEASAINAPPFPDQSVQVTTVTPVPPPVVTVKPVTVDTADVAEDEPNDVIKDTHIDHPVESAPVIDNPAVPLKTSINTTTSHHHDDEMNVLPKKEHYSNTAPKEISLRHQPPVSKLPKAIKHARLPIKIKPIALKAVENNGLFKIQDAAWVIQVGSYKNKVAALRVVNQLRAGGYSAFIQQFPTTFGSSTTVFVGPENKQASARILAKELEKQMHLRGIVISYKPLAL